MYVFFKFARAPNHAVQPLDVVEKSEMEKFFGSLKNRTNPLAPGHTTRMDPVTALERIMSGRPPALRHVWDIKFGPHFLSDCGAAPADVRECVAANIAVMATAKFPGNMGSDTGEYNLWACEIGCRYRIIYEFVPRHHSIVLYFMRRHDAAYDGPPRAVIPGPTHSESDYVEAYEEIIERSYETDVEKDDMRDIVERLVR